jgi:hypothetical protein
MKGENMSEKLIVMSLSVSPDMQNSLKNASKVMQISTSKLMRILAEQCLRVVSDVGLQTNLEAVAKKKGVTVSELVFDLVSKHLPSDQEFPIIIRVPKNLKGNEEELRKWLMPKVEGIIKALK